MEIEKSGIVVKNKILERNFIDKGIKRGIKGFILKFRLGIILLGLVIVSSQLSPVFLTRENLFNILKQSSITGCLALGQTLIILTAGIDLSVGSMIALSSVLSASYQTMGWLEAAYIGIVPCILLGWINGFMIDRGKIPPFIATLGMMGIIRGIALTWTQGYTVVGIRDVFRFIGGGNIGVVPVPVVIWMSVFVFTFLLLETTKYGYAIRAVGGNEKAAFMCGINLTEVRLLVYSISGFCAGLGGIIYTGRVATGQPTAGVGLELDSIAAAVIGGTSLFGGTGGLFGTLVGVIILGVLGNLMNLVGISPFVQYGVRGAIVLAAVYINIRTRR